MYSLIQRSGVKLVVVDGGDAAGDDAGDGGDICVCGSVCVSVCESVHACVLACVRAWVCLCGKGINVRYRVSPNLTIKKQQQKQTDANKGTESCEF